jgi:hypothetical protein
MLRGRCTMNLLSSRSGLEMGVGAAIKEVNLNVVGPAFESNVDGYELAGFTHCADPESADFARIDAHVNCDQRA